jgi:hypothetical protein
MEKALRVKREEIVREHMASERKDFAATARLGRTAMRALVCLSALLPGCGGNAAPVVAVQPTATTTGARAPTPAPTSLASTTYDGLYFATEPSTDTCSILGTRIACLTARSFLISFALDGSTFRPLDGSAAFAIDGGALKTPWGNSLARRDDPYLARIEARVSGHVFVRLDTGKYANATARDATYTSDAITMKESMLATVDMADRNGKTTCARGVLFADPTWNRSIPLGPASPPPKPGALGMRTFLLLRVDEPCEQPLDSKAAVHMKGAFGGARLFADSDGEPLGLLLEGYMYGEAFVVRGLPPETIDRFFAAVKAVQAHQAE